MSSKTNARQLCAAHALVQEVAKHVDVDVNIRLWDGSVIPLTSSGMGSTTISIAGAGVISSLLHWPTLDRLIQHYIHGDIAISGGSMIELGRQLQSKDTRRGLKTISKRVILKRLWPFFVSRGTQPGTGRAFEGDFIGRRREQAKNRDFITFHYDVGNDFYRLFLDPWMQYTCSYFRHWNGSLDQAQIDKMDMICRKLRLKPGERFLDIGCGWGGLICYAAEKYGVHAHGITLSEAQIAVARERIAERNLGHLVTVEIKDYADLTGTFDKISSIGMYEAIGVDNIPLYLTKVKSVLANDGLFLNHAIFRRARRHQQKFSKRPEHRALLKYIFPGGELDDTGHTVREMEAQGFEVHDIEGWRYHYAATTRAWYDRLSARREEAIALAGEETTRIWLAYLAGSSLAFERGSAFLYQILVSKMSKTGPLVPPTREDLYN